MFPNHKSQDLGFWEDVDMMSFQIMFINSEKMDKINQEMYKMKQWKSGPMAGWLLEDAFARPEPPMTLQGNNISDQYNKGKLIFPIAFACDILRLSWEGQP